MNFVICLVLIYAIALIWGLPNLHPPTRPSSAKPLVSHRKSAPGKFGKCTGPGPAALAGIRHGDVVVKVGDTPVSTFEDMAAAVRKLHGTVPVVVERDGTAITTYVDVTPTQRFVTDGQGRSSRSHRRSVPSASAPSDPHPRTTARSPRCPATFAFTGDLTVEVGKALVTIPTKVGALVHAIGGGQRDPQTPISVVGASIIGGDTVDHGLWVAFWFFLAQLNLILGAINLVPLLPFDGGHIAIAVFEKIRNIIRSARGKVAAAPVNYLKLMPATYVVLVFVVGYMLLTVTADLVNPIRLFQ